MRSEFLKIAGVKSEAEFYKKFPSEEAFMKKHGKAIKKLKAKKAKVGTMVPNISTAQSNLTPVRIDQEYMDDSAAKLMGGKSTKELKDEAMYNAQMASYQSKGEEEKKPGFMDSVMGFASQFSDMDGGKGGETLQNMFKGLGTGGDGQKISPAMTGDLKMTGIQQKNGGTTKKFKAHMMYNPKTGKGKQAKTLKEHLALKKKGWGHNPPKAQFGDTLFSGFGDADLSGTGYQPPSTGLSGGSGGFGGLGGESKGFGGDAADMLKGGGSQFGDIMNSDAVQNWGVPIVSDALEIADQIEAQKEALGSAKQARQVSDIALQASKTTPEKVDRSYVRPEDFTNTGEEFFPVYGVGTNALAKHGGTYKAQDGGMFNGEYMPLVNPNQQKSFSQGGYLKQAASGFTSFNAGSASYGGGMGGAAGTQFAGMLGVNDDAGSNIGGTIGGTIGSAFGPLGSFAGAAIGSAAGDLLDRNDRRQRKENDATARNTKEMAYNSVAPTIQAGFASHVKNGGKVPAYRSGGNMRGDYVSPNPSALDTMAMGGELKSLWGGELETVSYNPYAGGESVEPKNANSHSYRDPKTGQTGQGIAYGENSVNNNEASVEIEGGEPMQKLKQGGDEENLVVYGDMYIPDNLVSLIEDDRAKGKKFKSYVSNILNAEEAKINRRQEKVADLGLESDYTTIGQLERSTADLVLEGAKIKQQKIAKKKNMLAELQNTMNETFDQYGMNANKFIKKGEMVKDPMRIENTEMAMYGKRVPKAQNNVTGNVSKNDFDTKQIPKTDMTKEELKENGYVQEGDSNIYVKTNGETVEAVETSGSSLGYTPEGQGANESGTYGNTTQKDVDAVLENNTWFKGSIDLKKDPVTFNGQFVNPDVLRFQQEFNERVKGTDIKSVKVDGRFGEETKTAMYTEPVEGKEAVQERVILEQPETTTESTTFTPQSGFPIPNFQRPIEDVPLGVNQTLAERYALATNQYIPVPAQGLQSDLSVPYDISLQAQKNDLISMSRTLDKNPALENNPAALALVKGQLSSQLNQINETEFIANQKMKSDVYSKNRDIINQTRLANLGIFDRQAERSVQAAANTRTQNIDALGSIADKELQNQRDNAMRKVYANMYPTFRFNDNYQTEVQQTGQSPFSLPGVNQGINPYGLMSNISGNNNLGQYMNYGNNLINLFTNKNKKKDEVEELEEIPAQGRYGKKVTKNNKNSNILREIRNL